MSEGPTALFADSRIAIGAQPVSAAEPAGADIRREPDFEALEAEIRRMDADGPGAVRWRSVIDSSTAIIEKRSKDLLVGVWLAYGLAREEEWTGLAVGLSILRTMVEDYWETMQPTAKRERARVGAAEWLVGRLIPIVSEWPANDNAAPAIVAAATALDDLDRIMSDRLVKETVAFGELVRAVRPKAEAARRSLAQAAEREAREAERAQNPEPAPTPAAAAPVVAEVKATSPPPPSPQPKVPAVATPAPPPPAAPIGHDLERALSQLETTLQQYAEAIRAANLFDPRAYILTRTAAWFAVEGAPVQQNGRTLLRPPAQESLTAIEAMRQGGRPDDAIRALEGLTSTSPFFLDAQKLVYDTLGGFGGEAEAARRAVATQCAGFIRRVPDIVDLAFNDGRAFANAATRDWLATIAGQGEGGPSNGGADVPALKDVLQLAAGGKLGDAFALLSDEMRRAAGGRARFNLQLLEAQICLEANLPAMAAPLAIGLTQTAGERDLDLWEPDLAARAAEITVRALSHAEAVKYVTESDRASVLQAARIRLAGLDPAAAARLPR